MSPTGVQDKQSGKLRRHCKGNLGQNTLNHFHEKCFLACQSRAQKRLPQAAAHRDTCSTCMSYFSKRIVCLLLGTSLGPTFRAHTALGLPAGSIRREHCDRGGVRPAANHGRALRRIGNGSINTGKHARRHSGERGRTTNGEGDVM